MNVLVRVVNPERAAIVRRLFELYAAGSGFKRIADTLNKEGVPSPREGNGWAVSGVREMLHRELYRGVIVWNRSQKVTRRGTKSQRRRPVEQWVRIEAPELRIVSEELWQAVHARLEKARELLLRSFQGGRLIGRPSYLDGDSPYLLTGFTACSICGGAIGSIPRAHGSGDDRQKVDFYGCFTNHRRGVAICTNKAHIRQDVLNRAFLASLNKALDEVILERAVDKELARLRAGQAEHLDRRTRIERELSLIESRESRLVEAIKSGATVEPLVAALKEEEARKNTLTRELAALGSVERVASLDEEKIKRDLRARVAEVKALLDRRKPRARQMIRKVLASKIKLTPVEKNGQRGYHFRADGTYDRLFTGTALEPLARTVVAPNGIRTRVWALPRFRQRCRVVGACLVHGKEGSP